MHADAMLTRLAADAACSALLFDVDGTLAPIVARPQLASVPEPTRAELRRLQRGYLLVACISGRPGPEARALVGIPDICVIGNHGLELSPRQPQLERTIAEFRASVDGLWPVEDKGLSLSFHFREADDEAAAIEELRAIARLAEVEGLEARWGRKVLEIRPPAAEDKGVAVRTLLAEAGAHLALYAGDDTTDLDAFRGLADAGLEGYVRVAVTSPETDRRLLEGADLVVDGPAGLLGLIRML